MAIIQQPTLFDLEILEQLDIEEKYVEIFSPVDVSPLVELFQKEKSVGAPLSVNYEAAIRALIVSFLEAIPDVKTLVNRIKSDLRFKLSLGFLYSDRAPSEATFSRILHALSEHRSSLIEVNERLLRQIDNAFSVFCEDVAIDATAVESHSKPQKIEKPAVSSVEKQRTMATHDIKQELPVAPQWGIKVNSKGKNVFWHGYKAHLAVTTKSQYILSSILTSAHIADMSTAIPLIRDVKRLGLANVHMIFDKGYDVKALYEEAHELGFEPIIPLKRVAKNDGEWTSDYAPTCLIEKGYIYDSFDKRYGALKYKLPEKRCRSCPLQHEGLCQKVIKIKQQTDPRKFNHPARGTNGWKKLYAKRSAVERVNGDLKENMKLNRTTHYKAELVEVEVLLIQLAYNAKRYAAQRLNHSKTGKETAA
ncbi:transposase [Enterococcus florum]|uniref:Transposase n=1 Tax=Enterococcus florum TaxID=2480627 RepID=A0A4P5PHI9_9ENTE|nr:transposase [Enterococcus florum]GCF95891.1 transposase [Enterococcus florum]